MNLMTKISNSQIRIQNNENDEATPLVNFLQCFKICIRMPQHMIKCLLLKSASAFASVSA